MENNGPNYGQNIIVHIDSPFNGHGGYVIDLNQSRVSGSFTPHEGSIRNTVRVDTFD